MIEKVPGRTCYLTRMTEQNQKHEATFSDNPWPHLAKLYIQRKKMNTACTLQGSIFKSFNLALTEVSSQVAPHQTEETMWDAISSRHRSLNLWMLEGSQIFYSLHLYFRPYGMKGLISSRRPSLNFSWRHSALLFFARRMCRESSTCMNRLSNLSPLNASTRCSLYPSANWGGGHIYTWSLLSAATVERQQREISQSWEEGGYWKGQCRTISYGECRKER